MYIHVYLSSYQLDSLSKRRHIYAFSAVQFNNLYAHHMNNGLERKVNGIELHTWNDDTVNLIHALSSGVAVHTQCSCTYMYIVHVYSTCI